MTGTVGGLPTTGQPLYVRLWSLFQRVLALQRLHLHRFRIHRMHHPDPPAAMISPTPRKRL